MNEYTREKIKLRMLKRISRLWEVEDMNHMDPIVSLLVEAMSEEIFMLSGELNDMDDRLLSKLSSLLIPANYQTAQPAHGLLSAYPVEPTHTITESTVFSYKEAKILRKYAIDTLDFIPIAPFLLMRGNIEYIGICGHMYRKGEGFGRSMVGTPQRPSTALHNTLWIGIDVKDGNTDLHGLSLYFDFMNIEDKCSYLKLLRFARWSVNGEPIDVQFGIKADREGGNPHNESLVEASLSGIRSRYDLHYITLGSHSQKKTILPEELLDVYEKKTIQEHFKTPLYWVKVVFTASMSTDILENIRIGMNMFPMANITQRKISERMSDVSLYLPLETGKNEFFMEVTSVADSSGKTYRPLCHEAMDGEVRDVGYYSLRKGGVERFGNTNDSTGSAARLLDILRDRNLFSFSRADKEFNELLLSTTSAINRMADMMAAFGETAPPVKSYLVVDRANPTETLFVDYLTTNGSAINGLKVESSIVSDIDAALDTTKTRFITAFRSGRGTPPAKRVQDTYRYMLSSHDRILTKHDIMDYCLAEYGEYVDTVSVESGAQVSKNPKEGIMKTVDVHITLKENAHMKCAVEDEKADLLCKLEERSPDNFHYRLFIN